MINCDILEMAERANDLAERVNHYKPPTGPDDVPIAGADGIGRDLAIARTHLQTAELWLRKAAAGGHISQ